MIQNSENDLKEKFIKEQDILIYFWTNQVEIIGREIPEFHIGYSQLDRKFLAENLDILPNLSMNNLVYLLGSYHEEVKNAAREQIMKKFGEGEHVFSGENTEIKITGLRTDVFSRNYHKLGKENIKKIEDAILAKALKLRETDKETFHKVIERFPRETSKHKTFNTFLDNFLSNYEEGIFTPEKMALLEKLITQNPHILKTINFKIFDDEILDMGEAFISRIAKYPSISNKMIKLAKNNPELFELIKGEFKELENNNRRQETLEIEDTVLGFATRNAFYLKDVSFEQIANCAIRDKEFGGSIKVDCTPNYETNFERECDRQFMEEKFVESDQTRIDRKRNILLCKYFGMTSNTAKEFHTAYIKNMHQLQLQNKDLQEYISNIESILQIQDVEQLEKIYHSTTKIITPLERMHFEENLREAYLQSFVNTFEKTDNKISESKNIENIEFNGKNIKQIRLNGAFNLLARSTDSGFKGDKKLIDGSFKKTWQYQEDPSGHLKSCFFMNQDFLGHVPVNGNGVMKVYGNIELEDLSVMGPVDIDTHIREYTSNAGRCMYMTAENLPYASRKVYSEMPIEDKDPSYFLLFDDSPEQVIQNTYKAATEFDATILLIDKKEIEKQQLENLDSLMKDFRKTKDLNTLATLISTYETNVAGWLLNRDLSKPDNSFTSHIQHERFRSDFEQKESQIYETVNQYMDEMIQQNDYETLQQISDIMKNEMDKYELTDLLTTPISKTKMQFNAKEIVDKIHEVVPENKQTSEISNEPNYIDLRALLEESVKTGITSKDTLYKDLTTLKEAKNQEFVNLKNVKLQNHNEGEEMII